MEAGTLVRVAGQTRRPGQARRYRRRGRDAEGRHRDRNLRGRPNRARFWSISTPRCRSGLRSRGFEPSLEAQAGAAVAAPPRARPTAPPATPPMAPPSSPLAPARPIPRPSPTTPILGGPGSARRVRMSPAARRLAELHGVDPSGIMGQRPRGRDHLRRRRASHRRNRRSVEKEASGRA